MGRPKGHDEDEMLARALELFWTQGFAGTSVSDLTAQLGVNRSTLYAVFGHKQALYERALRQYMEQTQTLAFTTVADAGGGMAGIEAWLSIFVDSLNNDLNRRGCFMVAAALERVPEDEATTAIVGEDDARTRALLSAALERAIDDGQLPPQAVVAQLVSYLIVVAQGLRVAAKSNQVESHTSRIVDHALGALQ